MIRVQPWERLRGEFTSTSKMRSARNFKEGGCCGQNIEDRNGRHRLGDCDHWTCLEQSLDFNITGAAGEKAGVQPRSGGGRYLVLW